MSRKIILLIMKIILRIVKIILLIVGLETGYAERSRKSQRKCQEKVHVYQPICTKRPVNDWGGLKCRANEGNQACLDCRVQPTL